ncbi:MAG TPA: tetratricopeptide repeat protein [Streptosporangiaceae bacterium]|nr:tetratricopeptide repeat protein [Streptosporangiaceae bacterium]
MTDPEVPLRALLQRASLSPEQFAKRLNVQASELGLKQRIDQKTPYKWFRGAVPRQPWPTLAAHLLSATLGIEVSSEDLGWGVGNADMLCVPADVGLVLPWTTAGALSAATEVMDGAAMDRRIFLGLTGGALTTPAFDWLIARPADDASRLAGRRIKDVAVDNIEQQTAQLRRMDDQLGGGATLALVRAQVRHVVELLRDGSYTSSVGTRLNAAAAELMRLAGWLSYDAGQNPLAQRYWLAALHAAHAAGDRAVGANVLGFMSLQAWHAGQHGDAVKLAAAAKHRYTGSSPRVQAIIDLRLAMAYSGVGEEKTCRAAIDAAYDALRSTGHEAPEPGWAYWQDEANVNEQIGSCYLQQGDWSRAQNHFRTALRLQDPSFVRQKAFRHTSLALAYAGGGDPERAVNAATRATEILSEDVISERCVGFVREVQVALRPYRRVAVVAEFDERVNTLFGVAA